MNASAMPAAAAIVAALSERGQTVSAAESLTGGLVCSALVATPGSSTVLRGGIVAYDPALKTSLVDVPATLIDTAGVVSQEVAEALATGVRKRCDTDWGVATTGAAGPQPHGGRPPGVVWVAVAGPTGVTSRHYVLDGDREQVRNDTVARVFALLTVALDLNAN
jgi:nicotinamide-nucleotide amidase